MPVLEELASRADGPARTPGEHRAALLVVRSADPACLRVGRTRADRRLRPPRPRWRRRWRWTRARKAAERLALPAGGHDDRTQTRRHPREPHMAASAAAGGNDQQRAPILDGIVEVRAHLMDPSPVASSASEEPRAALAASCTSPPPRGVHATRPTPRLGAKPLSPAPALLTSPTRTTNATGPTASTSMASIRPGGAVWAWTDHTWAW